MTSKEDHAGVIPKTHWATTIDGACIAYQDFGEGPITLVVIHGWVSHIEVYWEQPRFARFMRRLAKNMRVIHFDKRGTGLSDRFEQPPGLDTQMDDVRAVMDATGVERAALWGGGGGGPAQAAFFAAAHPERTLAICIVPAIHERWAPDYPWGHRDDEVEEELARDMANWGEDVAIGWNPPADPEVLRWEGKMNRFSATPRSMAALSRMWLQTDVRHVLPSIRVPTLVLATEGGSWNGPEAAAYVAERIPAARVRILPRNDTGSVWWPEPDTFATILEEFLASIQREEAQLDRVLATVLFTDIIDSTTHAASLGDRAWADLLERHHLIVRALLERYRGREVDTAGDGFFATFDGPARGIRCAMAITEAVKGLGLETRAGLHTGEVETIDRKAGGIAVNIGARVGALAGRDEVLVSQTVKDLVVGSGFAFDDRGEHALKGVPDRCGSIEPSADHSERGRRQRVRRGPSRCACHDLAEASKSVELNLIATRQDLDERALSFVEPQEKGGDNDGQGKQDGP